MITQRAKKIEQDNERKFESDFDFLNGYIEEIAQTFDIKGKTDRKINENEGIALDFENILIASSFTSFLAAMRLIRARYSALSGSSIRNIIEAVYLIDYMTIFLEERSIKDFVAKWEKDQRELLIFVRKELYKWIKGKDDWELKYKNIKKTRENIINELCHCNKTQVTGGIIKKGKSFWPRSLSHDDYNYFDGMALTFGLIALIELLRSHIGFRSIFVETKVEENKAEDLLRRMRDEIAPKIKSICSNELPEWMRERINTP